MVKHNITVEDSSPLIGYSSLYSDSAVNNPDLEHYSGYASPDFRSYHNVSNFLELAFSGSAIYVFGTINPFGGPITTSISLMEDKSVIIDYMEASTFNEGAVFQSLLYSHQDLPPRISAQSPNTYILKMSIRSLGVHDMTPSSITLDYIVVETVVGDRDNLSDIRSIILDDTSSAFSFVGAWDNNTSKWPKLWSLYFNNGTQQDTTSIGAQVKIAFRGSGIEVHGLWDQGGFIAVLDNVREVLVERTPSIQRPRELLCMFDGLDEGIHTLTLTNTGGDANLNPSSLHIDYAIVTTTDATNMDGVPTSITSVSSITAISSPTGTAGSAPATNSAAEPSSSHLGAIIGGVVGGTTLLIILTISFLWYWKFRRHRREIDPLEKSQTGPDLLIAAEPYSYNPVYHSNFPPSSVVTSSLDAFSSQGNTTVNALTDHVQATARSNYTPNDIDTRLPNDRKVFLTPHHSQTELPHDPRTTRTLSQPLSVSSPVEFEEDAGVTLLRSRSRTRSRLPPSYNPEWTPPPSSSNLPGEA